MEMPFMLHAGKESGYILPMSQKNGVRINPSEATLTGNFKTALHMGCDMVYWSPAENGYSCGKRR